MDVNITWNEEELEVIEELNEIFNLQEGNHEKAEYCMDTRENERRG